MFECFSQEVLITSCNDFLWGFTLLNRPPNVENSNYFKEIQIANCGLGGRGSGGGNLKGFKPLGFPLPVIHNIFSIKAILQWP